MQNSFMVWVPQRKVFNLYLDWNFVVQSHPAVSPESKQGYSHKCIPFNEVVTQVSFNCWT